jgi:hypothetical protein
MVSGKREKQMSYNGWTNRETWLVPLWFENSLSGMSASEIEYTVRDYVDDTIGDSGFIRDLLDIDCIDWQELEEHYRVEDEEPDVDEAQLG